MRKSISYGVLALAVSSSLALANGGGGDDDKKGSLYQGDKEAKVTFKPGSGITFDGGDEFALNLKNQLQIMWAFTNLENGPDTNSFSIVRNRLSLSGHVFSKNLTFRVQEEWAESAANGTPTKDAWVMWDFMQNDTSKLGLRMGQSKNFFGLESTQGDAYLDFVDRSASSKAFANIRGRGAWVQGSHVENKVRWNAGVQNADIAGQSRGIVDRGEEAGNSDNVPDFVASISFDPMGSIVGDKDNEYFKGGDLEGLQDLKGTIGAGVFVGNSPNVAGNAKVETTEVNINTAWKTKGLALQGEVYLRTDNPDGPTASESSTGWYAQGTYTLPKSGNSDVQWGFGLRIDQINTDDTSVFMAPASLGGAPGDVTEITAGLNAFYHGHSAKTQINYTYQDVNPDAGASSANHILAVQFTLVF